MSTLEFIAEMTRALAWPLAAVVVALVFRGQIKALFARAKGGLNVGPVSASWDDQVQVVESNLKITSEAVDSTLPTKFVNGMIDDLMNVYQQFPEAAIVVAFNRVERSLRDKLGDEFSKQSLRFNSVKVALERGLITEETARAINGLRNLRNLAAHGLAEDLAAERALDYLVLVDAVLYALDNRPKA